MIKQNYKTFILILIFLSLKVISFSQNNEEQINKFKQVMNYINTYYVDSVDNKRLITKAIVTSLKELDPHSVYFDKDELEQLNRGLKGSFVGVGVSYDIINDTVLVLEAIDGGPSKKAGIKAGDRIISVDNRLIAGKGNINEEILKDVLTGKKGTKVSISVKRRNTTDLQTITVIRNKIPVNSIDAAYRINDDIVYIKLKRFSATSIQEFEEVVKDLDIKKSDKFILDLRNNTGGYLYVSVKLLENFMAKKSEVLTTKGIHNPKKEYKTYSEGKFKDNKLVILINENSASASEIVSGAIQDWDRGVIVGRRSFGKGLVQKPFYLLDGSMIRLTIAKYYTPSGRNIQKSYLNGQENYKREVAYRLQNGELINKDSIKHIDSLKFYTLKNKRTIFGGGGIIPDIFVKLDTTLYPTFYKNNLSSGKINEFIHLFVDEKRVFLKNHFTDYEHFNSQWEVSIKDIKKLVIYLDQDMPKIDNTTNILYTNKHVKTHFKALVAYDIFTKSEYFKKMNSEDETLKKAIEILNDKNLYTEILHSNIVGDFKKKNNWRIRN